MSVWQFFRVGQGSARNIQAILTEVGCSLNDFPDILDFGCGCGRTLIWLRQQYPDISWHGTDTDSEAIDWCRKNLNGISFSTNAPLPPLSYPDSSFSLVYGISVFTHLSQEHQRVWLPELRRVLMPQGLLVLTFYSEAVWRTMPVAPEVESTGFGFCTSSKLRGIQPDWYQTAFQTQAHLSEMVSRHFTVMKVFPCGFGSHDVIVARRD